MDPRVVGTVVLVEGVAFARTAGGQQRQLHVGDRVFEGEVVETVADAAVELAFDHAGRFLLRSRETVTLDSSVFDNALALPGAADGGLLGRVNERTRGAGVDTEGVARPADLDDRTDGSDSLLERVRFDDGNSFVLLLRLVEGLGPNGRLDEFGGRGLERTPLYGVEYEVLADPGLPQVQPAPLPPPASALPLVPVPPLPVAPVQLLPPAQAGREDAALVFGQASGNAIVVFDGDSSALTTTLNVASGTLVAVVFPGVTITGNGTGTLTLTGSPDAISQALDGLRYVPVPDANGPVTLRISTTDGALTDTGSVLINVAPQPDAPVATGEALSTSEDTLLVMTPASLLANDRDVDGDPLTITAVGSAVGGSVSINASTGNIEFRPDVDFNGAASFSYTVSDGTGQTVTAVVAVTVSAAADIAADNVACAQDAPVTIDVLANDSFAGAAVITAVAGVPVTDGGAGVSVGNGSVQLVAGQLVFTPTAGFSGTVPDFTYTVGSGATSETAAVHVTVIPTPTVASVSSPVGTEGAALVFDIILSNASPIATSFPFALGGGSASTSDYGATSFSNGVTLAGGVLTVPPGVTDFTVTVAGAQDVLDEPAETLPLTVGGLTGTGTINDDDPAPSIVIGDVTVNEGAGTATFTVTLSAVSGQSVSVDYATADGGAAAPGDYTAAAGTLVFAPGVTTRTLTVAINEDAIAEGAETFAVVLTGAVNATIAGSTGTGTIIDNDGVPTVMGISSPTTGEGTDLVYTVTLSNASSTPTTLPYALGGGTAAGSDYGAVAFSDGVTLAGGILTVPAGVSAFTVTVAGVQDALDEFDETVPLTIGGATGTGTIVDDDPQPGLVIGDVTVNEAAGTATFTVTLTAASGLPVSVNYASSNGTATAGSDYTAVAGTLIFAPGVTTQTITVAISDDTLFEAATGETFNVVLSAATNATITTGTALGTIIDNDAAPTVTGIGSPTATEGADLVYTVTLSNPSSTATTFAYSLGGGTASTSDYGAASFSNGVTLAGGILTVPAGVTSFTVTVAGAQDTLDEPAETLPLTIGGVSGTGTIVDDDPTPSLSIGNVTVDEAAGTATFTVTLSAASGQGVTVNYATRDVTATAGTDYTAAAGTLTFAPGVTTQTVTVTIAEDTTFEGAETFNVLLSAASNATIATGTGVGTITDNDLAPTIASVSSPTTTEGTALVYNVALSNASTSATTFAYSLGGGTASPSDYGAASFSNGVTLAGGVLTVPAGVTGFTVTVAGVQDAIDEPDETVPLTIGGVSGTGTILDDDPTPSLSIADITVNEAAGTATFTVLLTAASGRPVSVNYATADGTAVAGGDYTAASGTLTFAPGVTAQTITVAIADDTVFEGAAGETFTVLLSGATNAAISTATGTGTIIDNDGAPTITTIASPTATEGSDLVYAVTLSNASSSATSFAFSLGGGSASAADYGAATFSNGVTLSGATLTVPAGVSSFTVTVAGVQDTLDEANETVPLSIGSVTGAGTIVDDDAPPSLGIDDVTVNEGAGTATFTVTLSAASGLPVSVIYASSNGTATAGSDYTGVTGTLTFAPGVTTQTITVPLNDDAIAEGAETFSIGLSGAVNATIADATGTATIIDNDGAPIVTGISSPSATEGADLVYTVSLSNPSSTATTFAYSVGGGTASASDYGAVTFSNGVTLAGGVLTVPAGVTGFTVTVAGAQDGLDEPDESVPLTIGGVNATATIVDDDAPPTLAVAGVTVNEAAGTATFTVSLSAASGQPVSVNYATSNGTAIAGSDYTAAIGTLTFAPGVTTQTITIAITDDTVFEGATGETFNVALSGATNATIAIPMAVGTIVDNDSAPVIAAISSPTATEGVALVYSVTLSNASSTATTFAYALGGGTASATDYGGATFSNGVTLAAGVLTVPAGVTAFTVTVAGVQDTLHEPDETVPL
ncbi:MAG: type 1 secretion target domain protein, partial [Ramlibacter sp.]|nr:type 1 secretion target domain protein [Ramlibacter sp.]